MRRLWPWLMSGGAVLVVAVGAAITADSVSVLLGGGFVAVQLVAPVLVVRRRALARDLAAARADAEPLAPRPGRAIVRWVRLDVKPGVAYGKPAATLPIVAQVPVRVGRARSCST